MTKIAIIGGSAVGDLLDNPDKIYLNTPYGEMSSPVEIGKIEGREVAVLYRHGKPHKIPPHRINYRANIYGLKELGIERIVSLSAVGSLQSHIQPGTIVFPDQFFDYTKGRKYTFFDGPKVVHISMADPFCPELTDLFHKSSIGLGFKSIKGATYVCIEGPRFSTRAESRFFKTVGDIIGMTLVPEINLARESEMCYLTVATVTDYDVWADAPVSSREVTKVMKENEKNIISLLKKTVPNIPDTRSCNCKDALKEAGI